MCGGRGTAFRRGSTKGICYKFQGVLQKHTIWIISWAQKNWELVATSPEVQPTNQGWQPISKWLTQWVPDSSWMLSFDVDSPLCFKIVKNSCVHLTWHNVAIPHPYQHCFKTNTPIPNLSNWSSLVVGLAGHALKQNPFGPRSVRPAVDGRGAADAGDLGPETWRETGATVDLVMSQGGGALTVRGQGMWQRLVTCKETWILHCRVQTTKFKLEESDKEGQGLNRYKHARSMASQCRAST